MDTAAAEWRRGWRSLVAAFVGMLVLSSLASITSVIMGPVSDEFGWSRAFVTGNMIVFTTVSLLLAPAVGALIAQWGARRFAAAGSIAIIVPTLLLSQMPDSRIAWYAGWLLFGVINAGLGPMVWSSVTASLFDRTRGLALGIMLSSSGIAFLVYPSLCVHVAQTFGWRAIFIMQALIYACVQLPLVLLWLRSSEDMANDVRARRGAAGSSAPPTGTQAGLSLAEALRNRQFWQFTLACLLAALAEGGLVVHLFPILGEGGLAPTAAGVITGLMGLSMIAGRLVIGVICDRKSGAMAMSLAIAAMAGAAITGHWNDGTLVLGATISLVLGFGVGGMTSGLAYVTSRYFGLRAYASLLGITYGTFGLGFGIAPTIAGFLREKQGSYEPFFLFAIVLFAIAAAMILTMGKPRFARGEAAA